MKSLNIYLIIINFEKQLIFLVFLENNYIKSKLLLDFVRQMSYILFLHDKCNGRINFIVTSVFETII